MLQQEHKKYVQGFWFCVFLLRNYLFLPQALEELIHKVIFRTEEDLA